MTTRKEVRFLVALTAFLVSPARLLAGPALSLQPESALWLVGDSTLHPFTSRAEQLQAQADLDPQKAGPAASAGAGLWSAVLQRGALQRLEVTVPVKGLKSKESGLDKNLYKTLKADLYPEIVFRLSTYEVGPSTISASASHVKAAGTLRISGQERPVTLDGEAQADASQLRVQGQYTLRMTDYGVKPPAMMMGAIKVKDPVVIHYDLLMVWRP